MTLVICRQKGIAENYANLVCRDSNNNFPIFLFKKRDFVINGSITFSFKIIQFKWKCIHFIVYIESRLQKMGKSNGLLSFLLK
jgi:hypothetical protein